MIHYKDMTFCVCKDCATQKCDVRMTKEVQDKATSHGLPVSVADLSKTCHCYIKKTEL